MHQSYELYSSSSIIRQTKNPKTIEMAKYMIALALLALIAIAQANPTPVGLDGLTGAAAGATAGVQESAAVAGGLGATVDAKAFAGLHKSAVAGVGGLLGGVPVGGVAPLGGIGGLPGR